MDKLIITDSMRNGIKGTKIVHEEKSKEYKNLVAEANESIRENRRREAEAWIHAQSFVCY